MKKILLSAIFIILTYSVNAQTLVGTSFAQASVYASSGLLVPAQFLNYTSIAAVFNTLTNYTPDIGLTTFEICLPPGGYLFFPFPFEQQKLACGGLKLPPGKNWSISYSIDLQTSQPATMYVFLFYRQDEQATFYNQVDHSQAITSPPPNLTIRQEGAVLTPIDKSKPVYLYLIFQIYSPNGGVFLPSDSSSIKLNVTSLN